MKTHELPLEQVTVPKDPGAGGLRLEHLRESEMDGRSPLSTKLQGPARSWPRGVMSNVLGPKVTGSSLPVAST